MNIKEAKQQIKNAMKAYFTKDEFGNYEIPIERQRPVFLLGAPGIGKTAVMEQIAQELGVGLVSYSMTHHTRQSALGLPFITEKRYGNKQYSVSEYTMSEIIASVYDLMEQTGMSEGILFLDEINCVSETLAPSMLQFLQYKAFGRHRVPDGWIVVTAGNPPQYNRSVREFDIVTWDRLKRIDIEPDYAAWKEYALSRKVHSSILTYLDIKSGNFYKVETNVNGKSFVTARGWDDLSEMIRLYERHSIEVDENLIGQYIQNKSIAKDFAMYYELYNKYKSDYQIDDILSGTAGEDIKNRAENAGFDERIALLGLLLESTAADMANVLESEAVIKALMTEIKEISAELSDDNYADIITSHIDKNRNLIESMRKASSLSHSRHTELERTIRFLSDIKKQLILAGDNTDRSAAMDIIKDNFRQLSEKLKSDAAQTRSRLANMFAFCEDAFGEGQEILILVTELTINRYGSLFISRYGCDEYFKHNKELLFYERQKDIIAKMEQLNIK